MAKVSAEKIKELKQSHRIVVPIEIEDGGEFFSCYLKRPKTETLSMITKLAKTDEVRAASLLVDECWIEGDSAIKEDGILKLAVGGKFGEANQINSVEIKNL
jgi:hypothetical protein